MFVIAWLLLFGLLALFFSYWSNKQNNPNRQLQTVTTADNYRQVTLQANRQNHYVFDGQINGVTVEFLLDTGSSHVSIPGKIAEQLKLPRGIPLQVSTANGVVTVYATEIQSLKIGEIELQQVRADINPYMRSSQVLLGMSALRDLGFSQQGGKLMLWQRYSN